MVELVEFLQLNLLLLLKYLIPVIVSALLTIFLLPYLTNLLSESGLLKPNYRNENIPAAVGLIFIFILPFTTGLGLLLDVKSFSSIQAILFLLVILGMGLAGLIDDCLGSHSIKGFKGHLKAFWKEKKLTTGGFKALFGGLVAFLFSIANARFCGFGPHPWMFSVDFLLVALSANIVNLFDLRPGRAGKFYLLAFAVVLLFSKNFIAFTGLFLPVLIILIIYLPHDLKAEVMMGDSGSNVLGASLGMMMVWMLSSFAKVVALILLLGLQIAAEKVSFSAIIEKYRPLKYLDQLGRDQN